MLLIHLKPFGHDLARFTIGLKLFPSSISVANCTGKGKGGGKVDTSPIECAIPYPSKWGRTKLQKKTKLKTNTSQEKRALAMNQNYLHKGKTRLRVMGPKWEIPVYKDKSGELVFLKRHA